MYNYSPDIIKIYLTVGLQYFYRDYCIKSTVIILLYHAIMSF